MSTDDVILTNFGGIVNNSLLNILCDDRNEDNNDDEPNLILHSSYVDGQSFRTNTKEYRKCFSILSTNIATINAKFNELELFVNDLFDIGFYFSAICIQESWLGSDDDLSLFQLKDYHCISQGKSCSSKGGLIIYLHIHFDYKVIPANENSQEWECQLVEIRGKSLRKKVILGNIYRPPRYTVEKYNHFTDQIRQTLLSLERNRSEVVLAGDFNINLLAILKKEAIGHFYETMTSCSFSPCITLPTRFSNNSASLIDNIFCKLSDIILNSISGILID